MFQGRPEPNLVNNLSGVPLYGRPLALPTNIKTRLENTLAYYENP
jgi:hypothetical protein